VFESTIVSHSNALRKVRKRHFLSHLYIKCIILPRQARDKHRENSKKVPFSLSNDRFRTDFAAAGVFVAAPIIIGAARCSG
jgi:hypothetical protein